MSIFSITETVKRECAFDLSQQVRIITNKPFHFPEHERWIPFFLAKRKQIVYSSSIIITHLFLTWAVNTALPCTTTHTAGTVYIRTNIITCRRFFLKHEQFLKPLSPEKHVTHITEILQFHFFQRRNSERKPMKKNNTRRQGWLFCPCWKHWWGPSLPPHIPYITGSSKCLRP